MFPTPATRSWLSRNAFTGCLRPRASARSASAVKSGLSGSTPTRESKYSSSASLPEQHVAGAEAAHVHEQQALSPTSSSNTTRR